MADETTTTAPADAAAPAAAPAIEATESTEKPNTTQTNGDAAATNAGDEAVADHAKLEESAFDGVKGQDDDAASTEVPLDATPSLGGKDKKRKSTGGIPEHKTKKLNKKKSMPTLHLECKPGEFYWARLKGYPPWPAVVCDEEMLPESLLANRPVSTARPDGSIRDDFKEGGKNAKERTFPIMFLFTNEFQWMVNTNLTPLDPEECKTLPQSKMTKALQSAYQIASEGHDMAYFKDILRQWQREEEAFQKEQEELQAENERLAAEKAARVADEPAEKDTEKKPKKKAPRKSKVADEDADMNDVEAPKSSKKRKKDIESDTDAPKKTPKITKLNAPKTPNGEASASKKSTSKPKKKVVTAPKAEEQDESKPQLTEAEKLAQREKAVLYLRHRLQKGFLSRDQAPQESEMAGMAEFFGQLEAYEDLEPQIIRATKIHKVLKAIIKLASIPKDAEYDFKKRSSALLEVWNKRMEADVEVAPAAEAAPAQANGDTTEAKEVEMKDASSFKKMNEAAQEGTEKQTVEKTESHTDITEQKLADKLGAGSEPPEAPVEKTAHFGNDAEEEKNEADGDITMQNVPENATA